MCEMHREEKGMSTKEELESARWYAPFGHSLAYNSFNQHFTELNRMYWSHHPIAVRLKKDTRSLAANGKVPLDYFIVHDEDDRKLESSFEEWENWYENFNNFNRLNIVVALCSCLEVYMRSIVSFAIESKPGVLIGLKDSADGARLLKSNLKKYTYSSKSYPYSRQIREICQGTWLSRMENYGELFQNVPTVIKNRISELDSLRKLRNSIAHNYSRDGSLGFHVPITFDQSPSVRLSHRKLIKYMDLVNQVVHAIDDHLYNEYIGSYELLKYYTVLCPSEVQRKYISIKSEWLKSYMGDKHIRQEKKSYYTSLLEYYDNL